jgi:peptide/nickel transport system substrate-binding protein
VRQLLDGHGQVATADIAPSLQPYYDPSAPVHSFDLRKAAALLASAGFLPNASGVLMRCRPLCVPLKLTLWNVAGDYYGTWINRLLQRTWRRIGIVVQLNTEPASLIFGSTGPQFTRMPTGITYSWTNGNDPDDRFYWNSAFVPTSQSAVGGNGAVYFYRFQFQAAIDRLTAQGVMVTDPTRRIAVYAKVQTLLADQVPVIFLYWQNTLIVVPKSLRGFVSNAYAPLFAGIAAWQ